MEAAAAVEAASAGPFITVQIPESEISDSPPAYAELDSSIVIPGSEKKPNWFERQLAHKNKSMDRTIPVRMRKNEYLKFFAKDPKTGQYRDGVVEPPGGRKQWLQYRIQDFEAGELDDSAYERSSEKAYKGLDKKSTGGKIASAVGSGMNIFCQPYTFYAAKPVRPESK